MAKVQTSTQKFTELDQINHDIVIFMNGSACLIIEVSPTNFSLLSRDEQDARVFGYASFLNSLTFPIQIIINNRRVDISSYVSLLDQEIKKSNSNQQVSTYMQQYKDFVETLVKENVILDKRFYIVVPFSYLETGAIKTITHAAQKNSSDEMLPAIKTSLHTKAEGLLTQLSRLGLQTRILEEKELTALFHQMYNEESEQSSANSMSSIAKPPEEKNI